MKFTYNWESLRRHKIKLEEANYVYLHGESFPLAPSNRGNNCMMIIGFTKDGKLLEIGVEAISDDHDHLFHIDHATAYYRNLFSKGKRV